MQADNTTNNNRIERLNGTLIERVKVQRDWKSYEQIGLQSPFYKTVVCQRK